MELFYAPLRNLHIGAVILSGGLFFLRGLLLNVFAQGWVMSRPLRWLSYAIDTVLLTAALLLMIVTQQYPFVHAWLTTKVALLVVYIGLGSYGLKRGHTRLQRTAFWLAASGVFLVIVSIARTRSPLDWIGGI